MNLLRAKLSIRCDLGSGGIKASSEYSSSCISNRFVFSMVSLFQFVVLMLLVFHCGGLINSIPPDEIMRYQELNKVERKKKTDNDILESLEGLNHHNYNEFTFNSYFNEMEETAHEDKSPNNQAKNHSRSSVESPGNRFIRTLIRKAEQGILHRHKYYYEWQEIVSALTEAYYEEMGVIIFDEQNRKWTFCGFIYISSPFLQTEGDMRICTAVSTFGMKPLVRKPRPFLDYVPASSVSYLEEKAEEQINSSGEEENSDISTYSRHNGKFKSKSTYANIEYVYVNLFSSEPYQENCEYFSITCGTLHLL